MTVDAPAVVPAAPAAPEKPAAPEHDRLAALADMDEDAKADAALVSEIDQADAKRKAAELTEAERQKAADAGALMAIGFVESLSTVGMRMFKVDAGIVADVKKEIADHKEKLLANLSPVLLKYEAEPPAFIASMKHELMLAFHLLTLIAGIYVAIRDGRAKREKETQGERPALAAGAAA